MFRSILNYPDGINWTVITSSAPRNHSGLETYDHSAFLNMSPAFKLSRLDVYFRKTKQSNERTKKHVPERELVTRTRYVKLKRLQIFCSVINNKKKKEILRFLRWLAPKHSPTHSIKRNPKGVHHILTTLRRRKTRRKFCKHFESATPSNKHLCLASKASHSLYL